MKCVVDHYGPVRRWPVATHWCFPGLDREDFRDGVSRPQTGPALLQCGVVLGQHKTELIRTQSLPAKRQATQKTWTFFQTNLHDPKNSEFFFQRWWNIITAAETRPPIVHTNPFPFIRNPILRFHTSHHSKRLSALYKHTKQSFNQSQHYKMQLEQETRKQVTYRVTRPGRRQFSRHYFFAHRKHNFTYYHIHFAVCCFNTFCIKPYIRSALK